MSVSCFNCLRSTATALASVLITVLVFGMGGHRCVADVVPYFDDVAGSATGEFVWDDFSGPYTSAHAPDVAGSFGGSATLTPLSGGIVTGTSKNLYTFMSGSSYFDIELSGVQDSEAFTSIAVQFAVAKSDATPMVASDFSIAGAASDRLISMGNRGDSGSKYDFYWAQWNGLAAADSYKITAGALPAHSVLAGARVDYFNTASVLDIQAVPEPGTMTLAWVTIAGLGLCRRGRRTKI